MSDAEEWITPAEAADMLGMSRDDAYFTLERLGGIVKRGHASARLWRLADVEAARDLLAETPEIAPPRRLIDPWRDRSGYRGAPNSTPEPPPVTRLCMNCGRAFASTWIGNRLCERCK